MKSFEDIYKERADYVYRLSHLLEERAESAFILNQEAWRTVNRQLPQLQAGRSEELWVCEKLLDTHRSLQRRLRRAGLQDTGRPESWLRRAVSQLPLEYRWPLILRDAVGYDYGTIREILSLPVGTVRARLARARKSLESARQEFL